MKIKKTDITDIIEEVINESNGEYQVWKTLVAAFKNLNRVMKQSDYHLAILKKKGIANKYKAIVKTIDKAAADLEKLRAEGKVLDKARWDD